MQANDLRVVLKTAVISFVIFFAWKFVPVYYSAVKFKTEVYEAARDGATLRGDEASIRKRILWSAKQLDVPIKNEDLIIEVDPKARVVVARAAYAVPVSLIFSSVNLKFHTATSPMTMVTADDFKMPDQIPGDAPPPSSAPSVPADIYKNPPATGNSQSAN